MVTFQLVYSDGGARELQKDLTNLYPIALLPYFLDISTDHVQLVMRPDFLHLEDSALQAAYSLMMESSEGTVNYLPNGYHDYFHRIFRGAHGISSVVRNTPNIRVVTGHGYGSYKGGTIQVGRDVVSYGDISPSNVVTILDTCNSAHAVACMTKAFPDNPRAFNSKYLKKMFSNATAPIVCDRNEEVWGFQIGSMGEHKRKGSLSGLSLCFGDSIISCVVLALRSFARDGSSSLDTYFSVEYEAMNASRLSVEANLRPHSRLSRLEKLVREGIITVNVDEIDGCEMFRRRDEWFLSLEKPLQISDANSEFATRLIEHVVSRVIEWHTNNPNSTTTFKESAEALDMILSILGNHRSSLLRIRLEVDEDNVITKDDEGTEFVSWAISSQVIPKCLEEVRAAVRFGGILE